MSACCNPANAQKTTPTMRRTREITAWLLPSIALLFVPKCPACVAAYVAIWTGLGMSFTTATYLRWIWLSLCIGSLLFLIVTRVKSRLAANCHFKNLEIEP